MRTVLLQRTVGLLVLGVSLACGVLSEPVPREIPAKASDLEWILPTPTTIAPVEMSCPVVTDRALQLALAENDPNRNRPAADIEFLVLYDIAKEKLSNPEFNPDVDRFKDIQKDVKEHNRVWEYFSTLIPANERDFVSEFIVSTDGKRGLLAAVLQTETDPKKWALLVDFNDVSDPYDLTYTLIHEYGHLLTLNPKQVPPSIALFKNPDDRTVYFQELAACYTYFTGEGCSNPGSYMDEFYNEFWSDIYDEWNKINYEPDEEEYVASIIQFYETYQDRFLTEYAVTRPEEDIAESFAFFVLSPKPTGNSIAEQKLLFFYRYPELVQLRESILQSLCLSFPK